MQDVPKQHRFAGAIVRSLRKGARACDGAAAIVEPISRDVPAGYLGHQDPLLWTARTCSYAHGGRSSRWLLLTLRSLFKGEFPCVIFLRLHALGAGNELIERFAPSLVEPHFLMSFAAFFVSMHGERRIFRPASLWL